MNELEFIPESDEVHHEEPKWSPAKTAFIEQWPEYGYGGSKAGFIDEWRPSEHPSLVRNEGGDGADEGDEERLVYLDHAGATLCGETQLRAAFEAARGGGGVPLGSPHSSGDTKGCLARQGPGSGSGILLFLFQRPKKGA